MHRVRLTASLFAFTLFSFFHCEKHAYGQLPLYEMSASECYPNLLKKMTFTHDIDKSTYVLLSVVDRNNYEEAQRNSSLIGRFPSLPWKGSYEDWDLQRKRFFESRSLNLDQYKDLITSVSEQDPLGAGLIAKCFQVQASRGAGLFYVPAVVDEQNAFIRLFWRPKERTQPLEIIESTLENAEVVGGKSYAGSMFPGPGMFGLNTPTITGDSMVVHLVRKDPSKAIIASLKTKPDVAAQNIVVPPLHPPVHCEMVWESDGESGNPLKIDRLAVIKTVLTSVGTNGADSYWGVTLTAPGPISKVDCHKALNPGYFDISEATVDEPSGLTAHCTGRVNGGGDGQVYFAAYYKEQRPKCDKNPHW